MKRHYTLMVLAGGVAGLLSGLMEILVFGIRGAIFGVGLSGAVLAIRGWGVRVRSLLPGLIAGLLVVVYPLSVFNAGGDFAFPQSDLSAVINCVVFIPLMALNYVRYKGWPRLWRLVVLGIGQTAVRSMGIAGIEGLAFVPHSFAMGMLPFLVLWLLAMMLTDTRHGET